MKLSAQITSKSHSDLPPKSYIHPQFQVETMSEDPAAATTKKTVTTTTIPAATAVPVGSADDGAKDVVTAPRCLVISIVTLDAIALAFTVLAFFLPPLGFIGLVCAIVASILACIVPCQDADEEFRRSIKTVMGVHIAFYATYILFIALAAAALTSTAFGAATAATPLGIIALFFAFVNLALLITCLVLASILLCEIDAAKKR